MNFLRASGYARDKQFAENDAPVKSLEGPDASGAWQPERPEFSSSCAPPASLGECSLTRGNLSSPAEAPDPAGHADEATPYSAPGPSAEMA